MATTNPPPNALAFKRRLLAWFRREGRDLPWRRTQDPYAIWISKAMLQQTRVETVIPYWERFLETFPDVESLARADLDDVYASWTGLGYYSRARNLKAAAQTVVDEYDGQLPKTAERLRELKGIGRYTAGAVASIAFDQEEPLVDGNVIRVFTRWLGIRPTVRGMCMNPVDHPNGGGEGKSKSGGGRQHLKSPWGHVKGQKTRKKYKPSNKFIVQRRKSKKNRTR